MAQRTVVVLLCDVCEGEEAETHEVSLDGVTVELEACEECWSKVTEVVSAGRRKRKPRAKKTA